MQFTFMERQQNDSLMRSNLLLKELGTLRPNLEKSNPEFANAEIPIGTVTELGYRFPLYRRAPIVSAPERVRPVTSAD